MCIHLTKWMLYYKSRGAEFTSPMCYYHLTGFAQSSAMTTAGGRFFQKAIIRNLFYISAACSTGLLKSVSMLFAWFYSVNFHFYYICFCSRNLLKRCLWATTNLLRIDKNIWKKRRKDLDSKLNLPSTIC